MVYSGSFEELASLRDMYVNIRLITDVIYSQLQRTFLAHPETWIIGRFQFCGGFTNEEKTRKDRRIISRIILIATLISAIRVYAGFDFDRKHYLCKRQHEFDDSCRHMFNWSRLIDFRAEWFYDESFKLFCANFCASVNTAGKKIKFHIIYCQQKKNFIFWQKLLQKVIKRVLCALVINLYKVQSLKFEHQNVYIYFFYW